MKKLLFHIILFSGLVFADTPPQPPPIYIAPIVQSGRNVSCNVASGSQPGCISTSDWNKFNSGASGPGGSNGSVQFNSSGVLNGFGSWIGSLLTIPGSIIASGALSTDGAKVTTDGNGSLETVSLTVDNGASLSGNIGFYGTAPISKPSGPLLLGLANLGLISSPILQSNDIPNNSANTTGNAFNITATSNATLTSLSALSLNPSQLSTTVPISKGGTGATTANTALNALLPSQTGNTNLFLQTNGTNSSWVAVGGGGSVLSVALALPNIFTVSGSPVTSTGTLTGTLATQSANLVFAGPASGSAATPTFRGLASADIPSLSYVSSVTGIAPVVSSGGLTPAISMAKSTASVDGYLAAADFTTFNGKQAPLTFNSPLSNSSSTISIAQSTTSTNGYLSSTDWNTFNSKGAGTVTSVNVTAPSSIISSSGGPITSTGTIAQSLVTQSANMVWAGPTSGSAAAPTFRSIVAADVPTLNQNTTGTASNITATSNSTLSTLPSLVLPGSQVSGDISGNSANVNGTVAILNGGTGATTAAAAINALLPSQTGNSGFVLQTNGTSPSWVAVSAGGVSSVTASAPITSSGGSSPNIACNVASGSQAGCVSSTDWSTFNGKQSALTIGNLTNTGSAGITITNGTGAVIGSGTQVSQQAADATHNGYLTSTDWNTFNSGAGSGANTALSNLATTVINQSLNPNSDQVLDIGNASARWRRGYFSTLNDNSDNVIIDLTNRNLDDATGTASVDWQGKNLLESDGTTALLNWSGTSLTALAPNIVFQNGTEGIAGEIWTSTDTSGTGAWAAPAAPINTPSTFAGFDSSGNLNPIGGWSITTENGATQSESVDVLAQSLNDFSMDVVPTADSSGVYRTAIEESAPLDPTNTGFQIGNTSTGNGGVTIRNMNFNPSPGVQAGNIGYIQGGDTWGDGTATGLVYQWNFISHGDEFANNFTVNSYTGYGLYPHFDLGSELHDATEVNLNGEFDGDSTGFITAIGLFNNFGASSTIAHYHEIEAGGDGNTTAAIADYVNYNGYLNNAHIGQLTGIQFDPQNLIVDNHAQGMQVNFNGLTLNDNVDMLSINGGSNTLASGKNLMGISVNLSGFTSDQQKRGMDITDGALTVGSNVDSGILTLSGEFQNNILGGEFHIASGSPVTSTFGFGNNLGITFFAEDSMGPDMFLGSESLGFSINGFVDQIAVTSGSTVDTLQYMLAGGSFAAPSTGGTITNVAGFRSIGIINGGGSLTLTNEIQFHADSAVDLGSPTNLWGFRADSTNADNWFAKDLVVGGTSMTPTNASVGIEIAGTTKAFLNAQLTTTQKNALTAAAGMQVFDTTLNELDCYISGSWTACGSGGGGGGANVTLSNLTTTAINADLVADVERDLGTSSVPWAAYLDNVIDTSNFAAISIPNRYLLDVAGNVTVNWQQDVLGDTAPSVDWTQRFLYDATSLKSMAYSARNLLYADGTTTAYDWSSNIFYDSAGLVSANANGARVLMYADGTTIAHDWSANTFNDTSGVETADLNQRLLTFSDGNPAIDFSSPESIEFVGQITFSSGVAPTPTLSACGTGAAFQTTNSYASDTTGSIIIGTGITTSCTLTFGRDWGGPIPKCFVNDQTTTIATSAVPTSASVQFKGAFVAGDIIDYFCVNSAP